jgi:hypothetical protein
LWRVEGEWRACGSAYLKHEAAIIKIKRGRNEDESVVTILAVRTNANKRTTPLV